MSIAGGIQQALYRGRQLGCDTIQLFTSSRRWWERKPLTKVEIAAFREAQLTTGITPIIAHDAYLLNLASSDTTLWQRSIRAFIDNLERCEALGIAALITHPGAHVGAGEAGGLANIIRALDRLHPACAGFRVRITLELTAGQGTALGSRFEHLQQILEQTRAGDALRFCFDTQHAFAAGYDLRSAEAYEQTFNAFDTRIGLDRLIAFHLNDAKTAFGSRVDRHTYIGRGHLGTAPFRRLMRDRRFWGLPMYLETPKRKDLHEDAEALALLRKFIPQRLRRKTPSPERQTGA